MTRKKSVRGAFLAGLAFMMGANPVYSADLSAVPRSHPHLDKARAVAFRANTWNMNPLILCYSDQNSETQQILRDPPPAKVFDNLYNIGRGRWTAWAVTTSEGIILIDTLDNTDEAKQYIVAGLQKLGLDPANIKAIIISHGHGDHYGGARYLQETYPGAQVYMSAADYDLADKAAAGPRGRGVMAPRHDKVVADGDKLTLGDEIITMYLTPGHTPGTISMMIPVKDHGASHILAFWGGSGSNDKPPAIHKQYEASIVRFMNTVKQVKADGILSNHPPLDDSMGKIEHLRETPDMANPFLIGTTGTLNWLEVARQCNLNNADIDRAQRKTGL
jgi:metallo-beta-lactamase class B